MEDEANNQATQEEAIDQDKGGANQVEKGVQLLSVFEGEAEERGAEKESYQLIQNNMFWWMQ